MIDAQAFKKKISCLKPDMKLVLKNDIPWNS